MQTLFVITKKLFLDSDNDSNHDFFLGQWYRISICEKADGTENLQNTTLVFSS
jgi:hypothetical protein